MAKRKETVLTMKDDGGNRRLSDEEDLDETSTTTQSHDHGQHFFSRRQRHGREWHRIGTGVLGGLHIANGVFFITSFLVYCLCIMLISIFTLSRGSALDWLFEFLGCGSYCSRRYPLVSVVPFVILSRKPRATMGYGQMRCSELAALTQTTLAEWKQHKAQTLRQGEGPVMVPSLLSCRFCLDDDYGLAYDCLPARACPCVAAA